jgi:hypothetical protein
MTTVAWVRDANSRYQVSSRRHLVQIMHNGTKYTNTGSPPAEFWAAGTEYIQTADIDLLGDPTDITPIGLNDSTLYFYGGYDGGNFAISNYRYTDPNFSTGVDCSTQAGLFGRTLGGTIRNMRLEGVWIIEGFRSQCGMLAGNTRSLTENIECNFSPGSFISQGPVTTSSCQIGGVLGITYTTSFFAITLRGELDMYKSPNSGFSDVGGVVGQAQSGTNLVLARNLATFPNGIRGDYAGGGCRADV